MQFLSPKPPPRPARSPSLASLAAPSAPPSPRNTTTSAASTRRSPPPIRPNSSSPKHLPHRKGTNRAAFQNPCIMLSQSAKKLVERVSKRSFVSGHDFKACPERSRRMPQMPQNKHGLLF